MIGRFFKKIPPNRLKVFSSIFKERKSFLNCINSSKRYYNYENNGNNNKKAKYFFRPYIYALVGGVSGIFTKDDDEKLMEMLNENVKFIHTNDFKKKCLNEDQMNDGWELLHYQHGLKVLRRKRQFGNKELWEYRCIGTYDDISLCDFVDAQFDLSYRLSWDSNVSCLKQIYDEEYGKKTIIRWVAKFPWPMASRLYIYKRLMMVDENDRKIILFSKGLNSTEFGDNDKNLLRVSNYISTMVVECLPGKGFYDTGINYILTYIDDPEAEIPSHLYNYIVKRSGPLFLDNVCKAAKTLHKSRNDKIMKGESYESMFSEFINKNKESLSNEEKYNVKDKNLKEKLISVDEIKLRAVAEKIKELAIKSFLEAQNYATADDPAVVEKFRKNLQSIYNNLQNSSSEDKDLLKNFIKHLKSMFAEKDKSDKVENHGSPNTDSVTLKKQNTQYLEVNEVDEKNSLQKDTNNDNREEVPSNSTTPSAKIVSQTTTETSESDFSIKVTV